MDLTDLTPIFENFLPIIIMAILGFAVREARSWMRGQLNNWQRETVAAVVNAAVLAAEQGGLSGSEALRYAMDCTAKELAAYGFTIDADRVAVLIEGEVKKLFNMDVLAAD